MAPLGLIANYIISGLTGVNCTLLALMVAFKRRRSVVVWFAYFATKEFVDANLWHVLSTEAAGAQVEAFQLLWSCTLAVVSLLVVYYTFEGDLVALGICAVISDLFASICLSGCTALSNILCGLEPETGFLSGFGSHTILNAAFMLGLSFAGRNSLGRVLRFVYRKVLRHRQLWGISVVLILASFVLGSQRIANYLLLTDHLGVLGPVAIAFALPIAGSLAFSIHASQRRVELLREYADLADSYNQTVAEQLKALERGRAALEGHELVLRRLSSQDGSEGIAADIRRLEQTYQRLTSGTFCVSPALDAVLADGARRLEALDVTFRASVAGVPRHAMLPAFVSFMLLNLACEAAERTDEVCGDTVDLRIRSVGSQVFYRLEVPAEWGALWTRRFLSVFDGQGVEIVRERLRGTRRVVSVLGEGEPACA